MVLPTRVNARGSVSLPPEVCRRLGWTVGDVVVIEELNEGVMIRSGSARATTESGAMGVAGETLAAEIIPPEDFSAWDDGCD